ADAVGHMTAMAASLAYGLAQSAPDQPVDLARWMEAGLRAMRHLLREGHGRVSAGRPKGYPVAELARRILDPSDGLGHIKVTWPCHVAPRPRVRIAPERPWSMVESSQSLPGMTRRSSLFGLASAVVRMGSCAYGALPHARFGKFITAERSEIEMLRGIR